MGRILIRILYKLLDRLYVYLDKTFILRTNNINLIPHEKYRKGGKYSYAEWAHVIGVFQTLLYIHLPKKDDIDLLDVGCGTGLLGIACNPFISNKGQYVGIDVAKRDVEFCKKHYNITNYKFIHIDVSNACYAPHQQKNKLKWNLSDNSFDIVTALSVWTHLREEDAIHYMHEVNRVLKNGGKALISFFILDDTYVDSLGSRSQAKGRYHMTSQERWIFDRHANESIDWLTPKWTTVPEEAIGITDSGIKKLLERSNMKIETLYQGNWKEIPSVFFQDVLVLVKNNEQ